MLMKFTPTANFTNILGAAFALIFFPYMSTGWDGGRGAFKDLRLPYPPPT